MKRLLLLLFLIVKIAFVQAQSSLLWKIEKEGTSHTSWLYGTVHLQDKRVFFRFDEVKSKILEVDQLALELKIDMSSMMKVFSGMLITDSTQSVKKHLSEEEYKKLEELFADNPMIKYQLDKLSPIMICSTLMLQQTQQDYPVPMDLMFQQVADSANVEVMGIETVDEHLNVLKSAPFEEQLKWLKEILASPETIKQSLDELINAYIKEDADKIVELMAELDESQSEFAEELLGKRNTIMAERVAPHLKERKMLIAVGAAHLFGSEGLIELLRKQGYKLSPVKISN